MTTSLGPSLSKNDVWNEFFKITTVPSNIKKRDDGSFSVYFDFCKYTLSNSQFIVKNMLSGSLYEPKKTINNVNIEDLSPFLEYVSGIDKKFIKNYESYENNVQEFNQAVQEEVKTGQRRREQERQNSLKFKRCLQLVVVIAAIAALITFKD